MIYNFRQLADNVKNIDGKKIKQNTLVRSAYPVDYDEEQLKILQEVDSIFDLRGTVEISENPSLNLEQTPVVNYKIGGDFQQQASMQEDLNYVLQDITKFYEQVLPYSEELQQLFTDLKNNKQDILFHCTAGKDRTGTVGILLMYILDFKKEDIIKEYLTIDPRLIAKLEKQLSDSGITITPELREILTVEKKFYDALEKGILNKYDSIDDYLENYLQISAADKQAFKVYYLV